MSTDLIDAPGTPSSPEVLPAPPCPAPDRSRLVLLLVALGVLLNGIGIRLGCQDHEGQALALIWSGLILIFVVVAWRLLDPRVGARERLAEALGLGVGLSLCRILAEGTGFNQFDELLHVRTARDLISSGHLFQSNPLLPVSPRFPGLELLTDAVAQLTGLHLDAAGSIVLILSRLLLVYGLFVLIASISGSSYAAGIGVLVYCMSPQLYLFNSQYSYQTLAIGLMFAALGLVAAAQPGSRPEEPGLERPAGPGDPGPATEADQRYLLVAPIAGLLALAVTHHLTSWLAVVLLGLWVVATRRFGRSRDRSRQALWLVLPGLAAVVAWTAWSGPLIGGYLSPVFQDAFGQLAGVVGGGNSSRKLFSDNSGTVTPMWERGAIVAWSLIWLAMMVPVARWFPRWRRMTGDRYLYRILFVLGLLYPVILVGRVSPKTAEFTTRFSTFIFIGLGLAVGLIGESVLGRRRPLVFRLTALAAIVPFLGGVALGSPDWQRTTGPYLVSADGRSVDRFALQATTWAGHNLPAGSRIAADRVNGALLGARTDLWVPTGQSGGTNVGPLYFGTVIGRYQLGILARNRIQYLLVDERLATARPHIGVYVAPGEAQPGQRITAASLAKFNTAKNCELVYDNGAIKIFDVSRMWSAGTATPQRVEGGRR